MASEAAQKPVQAENGPPPTDESPNGLWAKLARIRDELPEVQQSGHNKHLDYHYATDADIYRAVKPLLKKYGVLLVPTLDKLDGDGNRATAFVSFMWVDADDPPSRTPEGVRPGQSVHVDMWAGTGSDKSGLAVYKAYTGAIRTYLAKFFQIPTKDNPEDNTPGEQENGQARKLTDDEAERLENAVRVAGVFEHLPTKLAGFGAKSLSELTAEQGIAVYHWAQDAAKGSSGE